MRRLISLLLMQLMFISAFGQFSLKGVVSGNGEELAGASVVVENTYYGASTRSDGTFEFKKLRKGDYLLKVSFIGFESKKVTVSLNSSQKILVELQSNVFMTDEVIVSATRVNEKSPFAYSTVSNDEISTRNMGQDIPYLLTMTPSYVATSDAGAGIGYTNFRIRGTDLNRINVTVNGIPMNDAESHGTWFVDIPDLAGSIENIQVQRGVGTSTNGAAAFGATINLQTSTLNKDAHAEYNTSAGSFNTLRNSVSAGTGLINKHFTFDVRLSKVSSDGFIDRASANLKSFFTSAGYYSENTVIKLNVFSGFEETYQAWYGVPSVKLNNDIEGMQRYRDHWLWNSHSERANKIQYEHIINSDARTYNFYTYENEVDHYQQDHYQLHFSHQFNEFLNLNVATHYTYGRGYYENYNYDEDYTDYQMSAPEGIEVTDLVGRKWLDNDFYGTTFSLNYAKNKSSLIFGGGYNTYDGRHFGKVVWAKFMGENMKEHEWYRGTGLKKDINMYVKYNLEVVEKLNIFTDFQYRRIDYSIDGIDDDLRDLTQSHLFNFFNPKFGIFYRPNNSQEVYLSYAIANREPNRSNFVDADPNGKQPVAETLYDLEAGYKYNTSIFLVGANLYFMNYKNQLIQTGEINDVGAPIMVNVEDSYRAGIEMTAGIKVANKLKWDVNATLSQNKINNFTEYVDNWDYWYDMENEPYQYITEPGETDLAFSPNLIINSKITVQAAKGLSVSLLSYYVSEQYIDNSSNEDRKLDAWFVSNLELEYSFNGNLYKDVFDEIKLHLILSNLFDEEYESNAWVYSYYTGGERFKMDGYFPQAGRHFMIGLDFKF